MTTVIQRPMGLQRGLSLIEIMVALTLGLILTLGLTQIFVANSQSFRLAEASSRVQESGRIGTSVLSREIRNADYWGCLRDLSELTSILNDSAAFDVEALLRGIDAEDGVGPGNSDRLYLGGVAGNAEASIVFQPALPAATMQVDDPSTIFQDDILIVTNCLSGDIFQVTNDPANNNSVQVNHNTGNAAPGNATQALSMDYNEDPNGGSIFRPRQQRFYLRDNGAGIRELVIDGVNVNGVSGNTGVFSAPTAIIEHVRDFQLQLGLDTTGNGQVNNWIDPPGLAAAGQVQADSALAVRFSFLIRSPEDGVTDGGQSYCYPGWLDCAANPGSETTVAANDTFFYRVYTTTASLRNRI
ncbi:type IV pilus assembly protein PilW [Marinobacter daqiaonensis]|uniref:Type IV pilus assembly protein PilW n=1 Tax=Marinobacter daqiaonensis TaxID=650891 RepID=A0A1I6K5D7_9GAMM|nr:PilW family protein [Marinobacter daqiaonensis]SFR86452.1 type IV pilus assembly protein PilW [Marinobacter daqiaonensis]